jgi:hypothetical protein
VALPDHLNVLLQSELEFQHAPCLLELLVVFLTPVERQRGAHALA